MTRRTAREMAQDRLATADASAEAAEWERCEGCQTMADPGLPCPTCRDLRTIRPA